MRWNEAAFNRLVGSGALAGGLVGNARLCLAGVGQRMAFARRLKKLRQKDLAEIIGVNKTTIEVWEQGRGLPSLNGLAMIADACDTTIPYLLGYEGYDEPLRVFTGEIPVRTISPGEAAEAKAKCGIKYGKRKPKEG